MSDGEKFLAALLDGDRRAADRIVDSVLDRGLGLEHLYAAVIHPSMSEIGHLWQENEISVAEEHLATAITQAAMGRAFERQYRWHESRSPVLLAACVDDERHHLGLRMLCDLLEIEGWDTAYLGAAVPTESLVSMVQKRKPDVVALSAAIVPHLPRVRAAIEAIRSATPEPPLIVVGGRALNGDETLARRLGADLTAADAGAAVRLLRARVTQRSA